MKIESPILKFAAHGIPYAFVALPIFASGCATPVAGPRPQGLVIENPYAALDWTTFERHKGNRHTHSPTSSPAMPIAPPAVASCTTRDRTRSQSFS